MASPAQIQRQMAEPGSTARTAVAVAGISVQKGGRGISINANGVCAAHSNAHNSHPEDQPASTHKGEQTMPSSDKGVTTRVTQGMAHRLTHRPASDTPSKNHKVSGMSARVMRHCMSTVSVHQRRQALA